MLKFRRLLSLLLVILMILPLDLTAFAEIIPSANKALFEKYSLNIISQEAAEEIESLLVKNSSLKASLSCEGVSRAGISEIQSEIDSNNKRIAELGASAPSDELLEELILASIPDEVSLMRDGWHPSDLIEDMSLMYDMSASYATTYDGRAQYHLVLMNKNKDPYLRRKSTDYIYDSISEGSAEARNWIQEIVKIYAEKLIGAGLGLVNPLFSFIPYDTKRVAVVTIGFFINNIISFKIKIKGLNKK